MSDSFVFSKIYPLNSITNPDTSKQDWLDSQTPFSFFSYLKYIDFDGTSLQINDLYMEYIKEWNVIKAASDSEVTDSIRDRYVELLKQITLKYTTTEEKRFLSNIDFNDPLDMDILIPFYSKKIREICDFYAEKRDKLKFKIEKVKIKGTPTSVENSIFETIVDSLFTDQLLVGEKQKAIDTDALLTDLDIEIEELYDFYSSYLDIDPKEDYSKYDVQTELRKSFFSANVNSIDGNIFINTDTAVKNQIFENIRVFLKEFGKAFTINYDLTKVNLDCKSTDALYDLVTKNKDKARREVELRYKMITKYIGSDFYYIQTGSTLSEVTSAKLFTAENPTGNLLNRHYPTTATIEENSELESFRKFGLFFKPDKNSILYYSVPDKKYKVDESKLEPNKLYIFPDPERYGNTSGLSRTYDETYPLIHIEDYTQSLKNKSTFSVEGDINSSPFTQNFYSYFSANQLSYQTGNVGLSSNLNRLYNKGIMTKWATDIWGNQYGLFKPKSRRKLVDNTITLSGVRTILRTFDGGPLTWETHGLLPDPTSSDDPDWVKPNVWASDYYYNILLNGSVGGYYNGLMTRPFQSLAIFDGLGGDREGKNFDVILNRIDEVNRTLITGLSFTNPALTGFSINTNLNSFALPYSFVIDGNGLSNSGNLTITPTKILDGNVSSNTSSNSASFLNSFTLSSVQYDIIDGGFLTDTYDDVYDFNDKHKFVVEQVLDSSKTVFSEEPTDDGLNSYDIRKSFGQIYVKDVRTNEIRSLSGYLSFQFDKYDSEVSYEIYNEVLDFGVYSDIIWIKTRNNLVIEKISYESDGFLYSGTSNNSLYYANSAYLLNLTNPYFFENRNYGMIGVVELSGNISNASYIVPKLYRFDYNTCVISKIYPDSVSTDFKNLTALNPVRLTRVNDPKLAYNSRNDKYSLMTVIEDQNEFPYIWNTLFDYNGSDVSNVSIKMYNTIGDEVFRTFNTYDEPLFSTASTVYQNISNISVTQQSDYLRLA